MSCSDKKTKRLEQRVIFKRLDPNEKVMVYPYSWLNNPDKREGIPFDYRYFLHNLRKPREMTRLEYWRREEMQDQREMRDLRRYLREKKRLEEKYSTGKVIFNAYVLQASTA